MRIYLLALAIAFPTLFSDLEREAKVGGSLAPDGKTVIACDLPPERHLKNKSGTNGAGLCVFTSAEMATNFLNENGLAGLRDWMTKHPGGADARKFARMLKQFCQEKGIPEPDYIQIEGPDLPILKLASKTGRATCVTYARSPTGRYNGSQIAHMVNCMHASDEWYAILDNNYTGPNMIEWMNEKEFHRTYTELGAWCIIFLKPSPPPIVPE